MFFQGMPFFCAGGRGRFGGEGPFGEGFPFGRAFGFGGAWNFGGDEPRARRGDIKYLLLELLAEQPRHGYELIKELENRNGGFYRPSPGSVYPTLQLLEEGGYLTSETIEGKRVYTITDSGRQLLSERRSTTGQSRSTPGEGFSSLHELKEAMLGLATAVLESTRPGNRERTAKVREVLERAKRDIYAILGEQQE